MEATGYEIAFTITHNTSGTALAKPHKGKQVMCKDCYRGMTAHDMEQNHVTIVETYNGSEDEALECQDCGEIIAER
jgi:ribosomal protein S27E